MALLTEIKIPEFPWKMDYSKSMVFFGSCFSENIGQRLLDMKYNVDLNPFGILYNPVSIANSLKILLQKKVFTKKDLFQEQGQWNSFYHHSRFSHENIDSALEKINSRMIQSHDSLANADFLLITFGTSWVYELNRTGQIVSNCHKVPSGEFKRYRLDVPAVTALYSEIINELLRFNPKLKIVFTVSPIRHWKDGAVENQISKAVLLLAIDQLINQPGNDCCKYFPSYEIMMDELRDYRFYAEDMIHVSQVGVDYIFERFCKVMVSSQSLQVSKEVMKIKKALSHRPVNSTSPEYEKFLLYNLEEINKLTINFPYLNFIKEKQQLQEDLTGIQGARAARRAG